MTSNNSIIETMKSRTSVRTFDSQPIDSILLEKMKENLRSINATTKIKARFVLSELNDASGKQVMKLGTYGVISGAKTYIIGIMDQQETDAVEFGFLFEGIVLYATELGLGTCWLGGTFKRDDFKRAVKLGEAEKIVIVSPLGYRKDRSTLLEGIMRNLANSNHRKPSSELFFSGDRTHALSETEAGEYAVPLEMVRLAPSASNKQPWRILRIDHDFHFYLCRTKGYGGTFYDLQLNDLGIAKCHFDRSVNELKLPGRWIQTDHPSITDWEYVTTWQEDNQ